MTVNKLRAALVSAVVAAGTIFGGGTPLAPVAPLAAAACTSEVGPGIPPPTSVPSGVDGFHASWYGQSGYPTLCAGDRSTATVAYYNSGSRGWVSGRMGEMAFLGTWVPSPGQDQPSVLGGDGQLGSPNTGWPRYNRVAAQPADYVGPNQVSWFQFTIQAPQAPGTYRLYIRPLVEGATWMEDFGVFWQVNVKAADSPPAEGVTVSPTTTSAVSTSGTVVYTATVGPATGCVDIALVDASTYPGGGVFRDAETDTSGGPTGDSRADLSSAASITNVNGVSTSGSYVDCVAVPTSGQVAFSISSSTANTAVIPVVLRDANSNNALDLSAQDRPTEVFGAGGIARFLPAPATFGTRTVTAGAVNVAERYFTDDANTATYRWDGNDQFRYAAVGISQERFEQTLSRGDTLSVTYTPDAASSSTFDVTTDVGRAAPAVTATLDSLDAGAVMDDVRLGIVEPATNQDDLTYSVQRASVPPGSACANVPATYGEIGTVTIPRGSDSATSDDHDLRAGTWCYRVGSVNPVTGATAFGYSSAVTVESPARPVTTANAPTSLDARVTATGGFSGQLDGGDIVKIAFSKQMRPPPAGATIRAQDGDGTVGDIVCGTNATCSLNSATEGLAGTAYPAGRLLTVALTAPPSSPQAGTLPGLSMGATVVDRISITDIGSNPWNLAGSADVVLADPD